MLVRLINQHKPMIEQYSTGERYYNMKADIHRLSPKYDVNGFIDETKPDWRIGTNFHANMVDQKVGYMVGNPIIFKHEDDKVTDLISQNLGADFEDDINDILTAASNKGLEWLQVYIDEEGEFKFIDIPAEQIVPIYKDRKEKVLQAVIRTYILDGQEKVEYWTETEVQYYEYHAGKLVLDYSIGEPIQSHFNGGSWGKVPFIAFKNNSECIGDIWAYKSIIDAVNKRISDLQNTFDESTELIYVLKGYNGEKLDEFTRHLRYYKAINVDASEGGGVDTITIDVPVTSSLDYLQQMREYIIEFGQGVDFTQDKFGNSPSGISLKFLYGNLDLKVKKLARKTEVALRELLWFLFEYSEIDGDLAKEVDIAFDYNRMMNEVEQVDIAMKSQTMLSQDTILAHHPWVTDFENEKATLNAESVIYESGDLDEQSRRD